MDGKGDYATAARFIAAMLRAGVPAARIKMFPAAAFGGWRGDGHALLNRLMEVTDYTEPYYQSVAQVVLSLALRASIGAPVSSQDLLRRLNIGVLTQLYHNQLLELSKLQGLNMKEAMGVIYAVLLRKCAAARHHRAALYRGLWRNGTRKWFKGKR